MVGVARGWHLDRVVYCTGLQNLGSWVRIPQVPSCFCLEPRETPNQFRTLRKSAYENSLVFLSDGSYGKFSKIV